MKKSPPVVLFDAAIPFLEEALRPYATLRSKAGSAITADDLRDVDALVVRTRTRCDEALLGASSVKLVITATIGSDHIDREWCAKAGIRVVTAAGCNARGVLQWVAAVLVYLSRREGWSPREQTLGIVGVGHVGSLVKSYAESWGFRVLCCDPPREERERLGFLSIGELAAESDIITFHTPLDNSTRHLCNRSLVERMKPHTVILNAARGGVVDEQAVMTEGLRYIYDVWEGEPHLDKAVLAGALLATPHVAGYSLQGKANASAIAAAELGRSFGWPLEEWYPEEVRRPAPCPIGWEELVATIDSHYDIVTESALLKRRPADFEAMRDDYRYRLEYF